jgi:hypothetical protein
MLRPGAFAAATLAAALAQAAPGSAPLQLEGAGPYYRLTLPASLHMLAKTSELADLRVRNAAGLPLPWAWQGEDIATPATRRLAVPLFPVAAPTAGSTPATVNLRINADGSLALQRQAAASTPPAQADWIVDTHAATGNLLQLKLQLAPEAQGLFPLSVEGSDDLAHWHPVASDVAVLQTSNAGQTLKQDQIDLGGARARYLRLRWLQPAQAPKLLGAELESFEQAVPPAPALQWTEAWAPTQCDASACTWRLPAGLPVDALRVELAETNTVASLRVLGESPATATPVYHRHHHPLHGLRHRERQAAAGTVNGGLQRSLLADAVVWRLTPAGLPEQTTPALVLDGSHHTQLRIEARHAVSEWGAQPPRIRVGTRGRSIAFLARGATPLSLAWGDDSHPEGAAVSQATLMPAGKLGEVGTARVDLPAVTQPAATAAAPATSAPSAASPTDHKPWLWAALGLGLLLLAGMAASLLKQIKPKA